MSINQHRNTRSTDTTYDMSYPYFVCSCVDSLTGSCGPNSRTTREAEGEVLDPVKQVKASSYFLQIVPREHLCCGSTVLYVIMVSSNDVI